MSLYVQCAPNLQVSLFNVMPSAFSITSVWVDDNLITGTPAGIKAASDSLDRVFKTTNDPSTSLVCGVQIERTRPHSWLKIHQHGFVMRLLEREGMLKSHSASTPLNKGMTKQDNYNDGLPDTAADLAARKHFRQILGCLVWLASKCRKDLCVTVNFYGRMGPFAKQAHVNLICGQPLRYLNGTRDFGLVYQAGSSFETNGASDADFAGCTRTSRSTSGGYFGYGPTHDPNVPGSPKVGCIIASCHLERKLATSTGQSETHAAHDACEEIVWLRHIASELGDDVDYPILLRNDNSGVVKQSTKQVNHTAAKHYRVTQAFIREQVNEGLIKIEQVASAENTADILTKALGKVLFQKHRTNLMGPQEPAKD